ncbi:MAG: asparagine synthase [Ilumatobacter sp.]|nr:asparagine synthase [Ilumatobacter sp.]
MDAGYYRMSPLEVAWGFLPGVAGALPAAEGPPLTPRAALEAAVLPALRREPCGVAFSGGRDSSLVLAVAVHVARQHGLHEPIPVTRVFPGVADADESDWQRLVIEHLGLRQWERIELHDEVDILGPLARRHLLEHGLVWPAALVSAGPLYERLQGGTLLDGEGGDEVLGIEAHRLAWIASLRLHPRPLRWWRIKAALSSLAPAPLRTPLLRRRQADHPRPWLRPPAAAALDEQIVRDLVETPLSFAASVRMAPMRRSQFFGDQSRRAHAHGYGVELESPLLRPEFVHAIARFGGLTGPGDRTAVLQRIAGDLLPDAVISRTTKASFNHAYIGRHSIEFAQRWDGSGVDPEIVDVEQLRRAWLGTQPPAPTGPLLQQAWLSQQT